MPWYRSGTVAITAGQTSVVGTGVNFAANARVGDAFQGPDGRWYEVANIASATVLSILPAYQGATVSAGGYGLAPMQGYVKDSADALRALVNQYGNKLAALGTTGNYDILPVAKGGTGGANQADARAGLGLGTSSTLAATVAQAIGAISLPTTSLVRVQEAVFAARALSGQYINDAAVNIDNLPGGSVGLYGTACSGTKPPAYGVGFWWIETQQTYTGGSREQRAVSYAGAATSGALLKARNWIRVSNNAGTAWGPWDEIFTTGNIVGTVSQVSGAPTGAIIERGANANGEYIKLADGTLICSVTTTPSIAMTNAYGSGSYGATSWAFPLAFVGDLPRVLGTAYMSGRIMSVVPTASQTLSGTGVFVLDTAPNNLTGTVLVKLTAFGRWY
ncbi:hypothetical protein ACIQUF_00705 [Pseudomonas sp. NPDC090233]|uniref:hypothetical protein n=1 Tax=Pseudomonas sp. NPDC090233 TaxID=3364479 RepID=UPI00383AED99